MYLLVEDCKLLKNVIQSGIKSVIVLKKDLIANQSIMKKNNNYYKILNTHFYNKGIPKKRCPIYLSISNIQKNVGKFINDDLNFKFLLMILMKKLLFNLLMNLINLIKKLLTMSTFAQVI